MSTVYSCGQTDNVCLNEPISPQAWDRWEVLNLVQDLRKVLGLKDRDIMVLRAHLSVLPAGPLYPGQLNLSFMKVSEILKRACAMDERRFNRGEVRLEELGLIHRKLSANGRRFPERNAADKIIGGYGIDLNPLMAQLQELSQLRTKIETEKRALRQKRNLVSARFQCVIRKLYGIGVELPVHITQLKDRLRNTLRRKSLSFEELEVLETEVCALEESPCPSANETSTFLAVEPNSAVSTEQDTTEIGHLGSQSEPTKSGVDACQTVRHVESELKEKYKEEALAIDGSKVSAFWRQTNTLQCFYPDPPRRANELATILFEFSSYLGLGQQVVVKALSAFGWANLILVLDYLAERVDKLKYPNGYLTTMICCYQKGESVAAGRIRVGALAH
ncbi:hypothetical protein HTT03_00385 [Sulfitobacter sp. S0837]|nr:helix-turn-helix domain-containing protein [Sulfitobacter maritimus]NUH63768.1 hypothetical protein [Sulfitobacter maritimus]